MLPTLVALCIGGIVVIAPVATENAVANGDTRTIYLHHAHTKESIAATYLVGGQYDSSVLEKLNWFLRDWRRDEATRMDPRLFDTVWEVYRESGSAQPIEVMSAYRSAETNAMLRRRSRAVAEHSQHILGKAMDQHYVDVPTSRIREIAMKLQRGGVGFYPTAGSPFVHMDVGGVRHWPRMSYDQLARLFPDGKTVHIPSNGQPLPRYEEARAELEARGDNFAYPTASDVKSKGLFAWLFGGDDEDDAAAAAAHDNRRGPRLASLDSRATGSLPDGGFSLSSSKNGGAQAFTMAQATPNAATADQRRMAQAEESRRQAAAVEAQHAQVFAEQQRQRQLALAEQQRQQQAQQALAEQQRQQQAQQALAEQQRQQQAQQALALAMAAQDKAHAQAPLAGAPVVLADASLSGAALAQPPQIAAATEALAGRSATSAPAVPLPPRRPVELAAPGPGTPLPPNRPTEFASLLPPGSDHAIPAAPPRKDPITTLMAQQQIAGRAVVLPTAITQGPPGSRAAPPLPPVLAYASQPSAQIAAAPAPRIAVPLPVARPAQFVAARLDRSNFRSLTASGAANRIPARSAVGSAVSALRPAAQSSLGILVGQVSAGAARAFGSNATDLTTDRFSGPAVKPLEHVITSNIAGSGQIRSATE